MSLIADAAEDKSEEVELAGGASDDAAEEEAWEGTPRSNWAAGMALGGWLPADATDADTGVVAPPLILRESGRAGLGAQVEQNI